MSPEVIDAVQIGNPAVANACHEHVPLLVHTTHEIDKNDDERYENLVEIRAREAK